jgi:hypothetical protein
MTAMGGPEDFLDKPAAELEEYLLQVARSDSAPAEARARTLQSVASAALGVGVLSGAAVLGSRSSLFKGTSWLVAKWLVFGASTGLVGIGVTQGIQELATRVAPRAPAPYTAATYSNIPARPAAGVLPQAEIIPPPPPEPEPELEVEPDPVLVPTAPSIAFDAAHEPKSAPRASSDAPATAASTDRRSSLTRELSLLERARAALTAHAAGSALQTLNDYRTEFPRGSMQIEAAALRVEAIGQSGNQPLAQRLAQDFLHSFPTSPLAARVRAISEVSVAGDKKP